MRDMSLHILDIAENSVRAEATKVEILIDEGNISSFMIRDNGRGMDEETIKNALNPFYTTKTERKKKIGLGLPLLKQNVELCDGKFKIESKPGEGTTVRWTVNTSHVDALPLGDIAETVWILMTMYDTCDFIFSHRAKGKETVIDSSEIKDAVGSDNLNKPELSMIVRDYIREQENIIKNQEAL
ncbi:MAG: ATP-binding protein [bacterium]